MHIREAQQALEALYAQVPMIACQRLCTHSCGPIGMTYLEATLIRQATTLPMTVKSQSITCPLLRRGACMVYHYRPMICRLWGVIASLPCPHACRPERMLTEDEANQLLTATFTLSAQMFPGKPHHHTHDKAARMALAIRSAQDLTERRMVWIPTLERLKEVSEEPISFEG